MSGRAGTSKGVPCLGSSSPVTGGYFYHSEPRETHPAARDVTVQDELLDYCAELTSVELPR
jgi:hypothetical protein